MWLQGPGETRGLALKASGIVLAALLGLARFASAEAVDAQALSPAATVAAFAAAGTTPAATAAMSSTVTAAVPLTKAAAGPVAAAVAVPVTFTATLANKVNFITVDQGFGDQPVPVALRTLMSQRGVGSKDNAWTVNLGAGVYEKTDFGPYLLGSQLELFEDTYEPYLGHRLTVYQGYLAFSGMEYFGPNPGQGYFLRADAGEILAYLDDTQTHNNPFSFSGLRLQCAFGYAMPLDRLRRFSLMGMVNNFMETDNAGTFAGVGNEVRVALLF